MDHEKKYDVHFFVGLRRNCFYVYEKLHFKDPRTVFGPVTEMLFVRLIATILQCDNQKIF